jgi:predicted kinase
MQPLVYGTFVTPFQYCALRNQKLEAQKRQEFISELIKKRREEKLNSPNFNISMVLVHSSQIRNVDS